MDMTPAFRKALDDYLAHLLSLRLKDLLDEGQAAAGAISAEAQIETPPPSPPVGSISMGAGSFDAGASRPDIPVKLGGLNPMSDSAKAIDIKAANKP